MLQKQSTQSFQTSLMQKIDDHVGIYASDRLCNATSNDVRDRARCADGDLSAPALFDLNERVESVGELEKLRVFGMVGEDDGGGVDRGGYDVGVGTREAVNDADDPIAGPNPILFNERSEKTKRLCTRDIGDSTF